MDRIGVDLGGTKIEIVALDGEGRELLRRRTATPRDDYPGTVRAVAELVQRAEGELGRHCTVGVGTPGAVSARTGRMKNCNSTWLNGQALRQDLEAALKREVMIANDANCFALSEATDGAGAGAEVVFGVILGTGVGGGIVVHGRALDGANAIAGEWGHNALPFPHASELPGPACYCGRHGCIETWLSGPGLALDHRLVTRRDMAPPDIAAAAAAGDGECRATLERYAGRLARALAQIINILDPQVIVLGGGLSGLDCLYEAVPRLWLPYVFSDHVDTRLVRNVHGDSSGVRGAARLWG
ncbi:MAG: ROK family protein [Rhodocyclaceae bacterium]|nr:ROK family protein [Rhodocyclaceae bacterium]